MGIAERDYMRRDGGGPQIKWRHVLILLAGAMLLIAFGAQHCSSTAKKDRHLTKGSLVLNVNEATAEELQTLPGVVPRARNALFTIGHTSPWMGFSKSARCRRPLLMQIATC
jgi:hypothetical protein